MSTHYLAIDLGAESGRIMAGTLEKDRLRLEELHRFPNNLIKAGESVHWNMAIIISEIMVGLKKAGALGIPFSSLSCDSWGVDYVLFDEADRILEPVFHYRDPRCHQGVDLALSKLDWPTLFSETGIQFMPINTLFQLASEDPGRLKKTEKLLMIADAVHFILCGTCKAEESLASTSQLFNPRTGNWSRKLISTLNLPIKLFPPLVESGTRLASLRESIIEQTGLNDLKVIAGCSHDTAAAVAAVPVNQSGWAYLSSGTWSLMGIEIQKPIISELSRELNFTNEIGHGGSIRLLKNIIGLWLVQECRRHWKEEGIDLDYVELTRLASEAEPFTCFINPADPVFVAPDQMPKKIKDYCQRTHQTVPESPGAIIRCALESLAFLYSKTLHQLEMLNESPLQVLHIVGGGSKNRLLNQFTANATGVKVLAGPEEATAAGNVLVQAICLGHLSSLEAARKIVANSFLIEAFEPKEKEAWAAASERFERITAFP